MRNKREKQDANTVRFHMLPGPLYRRSNDIDTSAICIMA